MYSSDGFLQLHPMVSLNPGPLTYNKAHIPKIKTKEEL